MVRTMGVVPDLLQEVGMTTQDLINTLKQGKPMTDKLMREIVRELERKASLVEALKKIANLYWQDAPCPQEMRDIAREALGDE